MIQQPVTHVIPNSFITNPPKHVMHAKNFVQLVLTIKHVPNVLRVIIKKMNSASKTNVQKDNFGIMLLLHAWLVWKIVLNATMQQFAINVNQQHSLIS